MLKHIDSKTIFGVSGLTSNEKEMRGKGIIAGLWKKFLQKSSPEMPQYSPFYGIYHDYESDMNGSYRILIGSEKSNMDRIDTVHIYTGKYREFKAQGEMPKTVISLWQEVWTYYQNHPEEERAYCTDIEYYDAEDSVSIFIGINEK